MNKNLLLVTLLVVGLGAGFFGGMQYQKSQAAGGRNGTFTRRTGQNGQNTQAIRGSVNSIDSGSLTIKMTDGSSKIVLINDQTSIAKNATASASDIKSGEMVTAFGTANSDGSITASNVQIGGNFGFRNMSGQGQ